MIIKSKRMKYVRHGSCMRERSAYRILVCKHEANKVGVLNSLLELILPVKCYLFFILEMNDLGHRF
jgi:hypothetical protein